MPPHQSKNMHFAETKTRTELESDRMNALKCNHNPNINPNRNQNPATRSRRELFVAIHIHFFDMFSKANFKRTLNNLTRRGLVTSLQFQGKRLFVSAVNRYAIYQVQCHMRSLEPRLLELSSTRAVFDFESVGLGRLNPESLDSYINRTFPALVDPGSNRGRSRPHQTEVEPSLTNHC